MPGRRRSGGALALRSAKAAIPFFWALCWFASGTVAQTLAPFKDRLFAYPPIIEEAVEGAFRRYAYSEARDIDERDAIPERRAGRDYVDLSANRQRRARSLPTQAGMMELYETGRAEGARFVIVFVHGRGGDRSLGDDDWSFGGNFNRLKNLAVRNGGTYYVPSLPDFGPAGLAALRAVLMHAATVSPGAPIVMACASMGAGLCWHATDADFASHLDGLIALGGEPATGITRSRAFSLRVPVFLAHGSRDSVYPWQAQRGVLQSMRKADPDYPVRLALFDGGTHGTPIRMIDWRDTLNWIFADRRP